MSTATIWRSRQAGVATTATMFALVGLVCFVLDTALVAAIDAATGSLVGAVVGARLVSASVNFTANRYLVFDGADVPLPGALGRYAALAAGVLVVNYLLLRALTGWGLGLVAAKVIVEATVMVMSFLVQRTVVFVRRQVAR